MASKIVIPKRYTIKPKEKGVQPSLHEPALLFIQKLFPNKVNFSITEVASVLNVSYDFICEHIISEEIILQQYGDRETIKYFELLRLSKEFVSFYGIRMGNSNSFIYN